MKSLIQSALVVAALCVGIAVSIQADGSVVHHPISNNSILPDAAPRAADCKVQVRQAFADCVQSPHVFAWSQAERVMQCEILAEKQEQICLHGYW